MPYILSPIIKINSPGMWSEGQSYEKNSIYKIEEGKLPPVNYDEHIIRPHSLTHLETPAHTIKHGKRLEKYFHDSSSLDHFFGETVVLKLKGDHYKGIEKGQYHWIVTKEQIQELLVAMKLKSKPKKILITTEKYFENSEGYHDPNYVLTLSLEAAQYLTQELNINLFGISWKSSDYSPGSSERPIHNQIFSSALILENLKLNHVPEGVYFLTAFPILLADASESPVTPVLFRYDELPNS